MTLPPRENTVLFGHEAAEAKFASAIASGRVHHAWLLTGPEGVGKATLAYRLARRLLAGPAFDNPDNAICKRIARGSHADILTIEREYDEKRRRYRSEITVDQVRIVTNFLHLTSAEGGWRVVIVDGAEEMNRNAANALLKILEEPPRQAIIFLTASAPGRLLPTLRSRCRKLALDALNADAMHAALALLLPDMPDADRTRLAEIAEGAPGRAVHLAEDGALALAALVQAVLQEAPAIPVPRMHAIADQATKSENGFETFMTLLQARLGETVRSAARADGRAGGLAAQRPLAEWGEVWHALGRLADETERFNLDKRTAIIAGLELLTGP